MNKKKKSSRKKTSPPKSSWKGNLLLLSTTLLTLLLLGEISARIGFHLHDRSMSTGMRILWSWAYASIAEPHSSGIQETPEFTISLRSNREGFRENEPVYLGKTGIAFLGDSYTWGTGVEEEERFSNLLARKLGIPVGNYGLCTSGTINELAVYDDFVRYREPGRVILVFYPNDLENNSWYLGYLGPENTGNRDALETILVQLRQVPLSWPDEKNLLVPQAGFSAFITFIENRFSALFPDKPETVEARLPSGKKVIIDKNILIGNSNWAGALINYTFPLRKLWEMTGTLLAILRDRIADRGQELIVVYLPYQEAIQPGDWELRKKRFRLSVPDRLLDFDRPRRELQEICRSLGLKMIDLTPGLREEFAHSKKRLYYLYDAHLTRAGHRKVAEILGEALAPNETSGKREDQEP